MRIGVAKEIKSEEYRVALTPAGALELINKGHDVAIESGAGIGSAFPDDAYTRVGARIVPSTTSGSAPTWCEEEPIASSTARLC
jgi:alanine dehydrogenase